MKRRAVSKAGEHARLIEPLGIADVDARLHHLVADPRRPRRPAHVVGIDVVPRFRRIAPDVKRDVVPRRLRRRFVGLAAAARAQDALGLGEKSGIDAVLRELVHELDEDVRLAAHDVDDARQVTVLLRAARHDELRIGEHGELDVRTTARDEIHERTELIEIRRLLLRMEPRDVVAHTEHANEIGSDAGPLVQERRDVLAVEVFFE